MLWGIPTINPVYTVASGEGSDVQPILKKRKKEQAKTSVLSLLKEMREERKGGEDREVDGIWPSKKCFFDGEMPWLVWEWYQQEVDIEDVVYIS